METELSEEVLKKKEIFDRLKEEGKEINYFPEIDTLFSDLNKTLTEEYQNLGIRILRHLDNDIAEKIEEMTKKNRPRDAIARHAVTLCKGKTIIELIEAGEKAADEYEVPDDIAAGIRYHPSTFVIYTHIPDQAASYIRKKVDPIYNYGREEPTPIHRYATIVEHEIGKHKVGILTGRILFLPGNFFREHIPDLYKKHFQK